MADGAVIGPVLCGMAFGLVLAALIGGVILRAAVSLANKFLGGTDAEDAIPEPSFGKAMGIWFVTVLVNMVVGFMIGLVIGGAAAVGGAEGQGPVIVAQLVSIPVGFLVMAGMLTLMLPTTFGRALLVALCNFLIAIAIGVVIFVIFFAISMVFLVA